MSTGGIKKPTVHACDLGFEAFVTFALQIFWVATVKLAHIS